MRGILAILVFAMTACQSNYSDVVTYRCGDKVVTWSMIDDQTSILDVDKTSFRLVRVFSASGVRWQAGDLVFWTKGTEAMILNKGIKTLSCAVSP